MKLDEIAKKRIRLESRGERWLIMVDQKAIISATDRRWLRRLAVTIRRRLAGREAGYDEHPLGK
jgi:hypothetical protein